MCLCPFIPMLLSFSSDIRHTPTLPLPHRAVALEDCPFFDDEGRRVDVAVHLAVAVDLDALIGDDFSDHRSTDGDAADVDIAFDVRRLADDQLILRRDAAIE